MDEEMFCLTPEDKEVAIEIVKKFLKEKQRDQEFPRLSFKKLYSIFNNEKEKALFEKILKIDPKKYGQLGCYYEVWEAPDDLVPIENQTYEREGVIKKVDLQYLPEEAYLAFRKMNEAMKKQIGCSLNIVSGYRSPAYQLLLFLYFLEKDKWDIKKTLRRVALPGWSEHGCPLKQGMDFACKDYRKMEDFDKSEEYKWLNENASRFGFYLSFPKGNEFGIMYEPWHWHYEPEKNVN